MCVWLHTDAVGLFRVYYLGQSGSMFPSFRIMVSYRCEVHGWSQTIRFHASGIVVAPWITRIEGPVQASDLYRVLAIRNPFSSYSVNGLPYLDQLQHVIIPFIFQCSVVSGNPTLHVFL